MCEQTSRVRTTYTCNITSNNEFIWSGFYNCLDDSMQCIPTYTYKLHCMECCVQVHVPAQCVERLCTCIITYMYMYVNCTICEAVVYMYMCRCTCTICKEVVCMHKYSKYIIMLNCIEECSV